MCECISDDKRSPRINAVIEHDEFEIPRELVFGKIKREDEDEYNNQNGN